MGIVYTPFLIIIKKNNIIWIIWISKIYSKFGKLSPA